MSLKEVVRRCAICGAQVETEMRPVTVSIGGVWNKWLMCPKHMGQFFVRVNDLIEGMHRNQGEAKK
jgi:transcription elongation factor Elf1